MLYFIDHTFRNIQISIINILKKSWFCYFIIQNIGINVLSILLQVVIVINLLFCLTSNILTWNYHKFKFLMDADSITRVSIFQLHWNGKKSEHTQFKNVYYLFINIFMAHRIPQMLIFVYLYYLEKQGNILRCQTITEVIKRQYGNINHTRITYWW